MPAWTISWIRKDSQPIRSDLVKRDRLFACATESDAAAPAHPFLFDLTELVGHFQGQRLPNGIERVQIELTLAALEECGPRKVMLCSFLNSREAWVEIPSDRFRDIVSLATSGSDVADPDWQVARAHLVLHLIFAAPLVPPRGATLVNTGTSWRVHYYFRFVRDLKARHGLRWEERRVGKEGGRTCRSRWSPYH